MSTANPATGLILFIFFRRLFYPLLFILAIIWHTLSFLLTPIIWFLNGILFFPLLLFVILPSFVAEYIRTSTCNPTETPYIPAADLDPDGEAGDGDEMREAERFSTRTEGYRTNTQQGYSISRYTSKVEPGTNGIEMTWTETRICTTDEISDIDLGEGTVRTVETVEVEMALGGILGVEKWEERELFVKTREDIVERVLEWLVELDG